MNSIKIYLEGENLESKLNTLINGPVTYKNFKKTIYD